MTNSQRKNNKRRSRTRPHGSSQSKPTKERPDQKIADPHVSLEKIKYKASRYLPEPATVYLNGEATELKSPDDFRSWEAKYYDNTDSKGKRIVKIEVGNAICWQEGTINGVVDLYKSFGADLLRDGVTCTQSDIYETLLQTFVDANDNAGYLQLKNLMLHVSARFFQEQQPPVLVALKKRLKDLGFAGDDLRKLKSKELEIRQQHLEKDLDSGPVSSRTPISESWPEMPIPENSRQIVEPKLYSLTHSGVGKQIEPDQVFLRTPLVITAKYIDSYSGTISVKLVFRCQDKFVSKVVSRDVISDKRKILELSMYGLPVTNDNAMEVIRYLQAFEQVNEFRIEQSSTTSRLGIHHVEREVPKITDGDVKLSQKYLAKIKARVHAKLKKMNNSNSVSKSSEQFKSMVKLETRLAIEKVRQKKAAKLLRGYDESARNGTDMPDLPDGFETIRTTVFVLPDSAYSSHYLEPNICFHSSECEIAEQVAGFRSKGDQEAWNELMIMTEAYPQVRLAVVAAFAPLLRIFIEFENLILDFCGRTTSGKTTTLRLAAAGFGCPNQSDPTGSVIFSLAGTATFNERRAGLLRNLPLLLDESKLADPGILSKFAYMLSSGTSKGRGTVKGVQSMTKFETIGIFTGEQPIVADSKDGGAKVRAVPFFGGPFGDESAEIGQLAGLINERVEHNYGHALPAMLKYIFDNQGQWPSWKKLFEKYKKELKKRADDADNKYAARLVPTLAAFKLAEYLLAECLKIPGIDVVEANWDNFVVETSVADQSKLALEFIHGFAVQHRERFWDSFRHYTPSRYEPSGGWLGRWDLAQNNCIPGPIAEPGWSYIGFIPTELKSLLRDQGFDADAVLRQWKLDNVLVCDTNRNDRQVVFGLDKNRIRLVCITKAAIDALDNSHQQSDPPVSGSSDDGYEDYADDQDGDEVQVELNA